MATATYTLNCTKGAYTDYYNKGTNNPLSRSTNYLINGTYSVRYHQLFLGFQTIPASLERKRLYYVRARFYFRPGRFYAPVGLCNGNFTQSEVTYNNKPSTDISDFDYCAAGSIPKKDTGFEVPDSWKTQWIYLYGEYDDAAKKSERAKSFIKYHGLVISSDDNDYYDSELCYVRGGLSDNSAIFVQLVYDDEVDVTSQITRATYPTTGANPKSAQTFTWKFVRSGDYRCKNETWTQASATLYYREQGASSWRSIAASGTTMSASIPANTLKSSTTYEYYLKGTDNEGTTTQTAVFTFTTTDNTITPASYPTSPANPCVAQKFTWSYTAGSTFTQTSAKLFWKKSTESSWNQISVSGSAKSLTVAAATFPVGSTIQWYLSGTDSTGKTTTSATKSFTTPTSTIEATSYPSGNKVNNAVQQTFSWRYTSEAGNYTQASAILYWRVSGASSWNQISISGTTTSKTLAAYTLPPNSTIEWKITGTDIGGTTTTTGPWSFKTLPFSVTPTNYPSGSNIDTRSALTFEYTLQNEDGKVLQNGSTFYWRVSGASSWNAISLVHTSWSRTIAANTFPTASTIQWKIQATDRSGLGTAESNVFTFTTVSTQITATIYPSGSNVYTGAAIKFQWKFASAVGDYTQTSAKLYWRKSTSDPWTAINASGATTSITVPANTFPTASTIYWYLEGTDRGGHTTTTSTASFNSSTTQITPQNCPTGGYYNPRNAITFSWYFAASGGSIPQGSASLFWKVSTASTYNEIQASGTTTNVTVAANTFPVASLIDWYISGTDKWGVSSSSEVFQFSTTASQMRAIAKSPISGTIDGSNAITFVWTLTSDDGFPASRVDLLWKLPSESSSSWHTIVSSNTSITEYTVAADYFSPGQINWLVRAWNIDGVQGPDSIASVVVLVAPKVSGVSATTVPWSTISWQANDQQSFQIDVDGKLYGPYFGTEKQFELPDFLRDGVHTIKVRVLGSFNLWSEWTETTVSIENDPGEEITLTGSAGVDVALEWLTEEATADFYIYRDDVMIGHTAAAAFTDRFSIGEHTFTVVNRLADGNYSISNELRFETEVENMHIAAKDGGEWIELVHTIKNNSNPEYTESFETVYNKMSGHTFPAVSASEYMETPIKCTAVFLYTEEEAHARFRKLLGKTVIIKTKDGGCYVCFLASWERLPKEKYYTAYKFTLRRINWEDFIDDT